MVGIGSVQATDYVWRRGAGAGHGLYVHADMCRRGAGAGHGLSVQADMCRRGACAGHGLCVQATD
jgi:hypothetical protein